MDQLLVFLNEATLAISVKHLFILMAFLSACVLLGKNKLGLLGTYAFLLYWGFMANRGQMVSSEGVEFGVYLYPILALFLVAIAIIGFFRSSD